ncbi:hypothetical protein O181_113263 [Austropuccinia psidii MF-1]|uniref:Uncharacterized protein n=1 Tax=Austropuccinia psidii MF-1 TaxID=1389203 RepID=A0A9Q3K237_9BASI|nr:hypothetical protein [Austropuccinia psidii MF-1]
MNKTECKRTSKPQVFYVENSQLANEFSTSSHNLEPSMGQECLKEVPNIKEWPHVSGEREYDYMELTRRIDIIKEEFELPEILVKDRFSTLSTKSAHRWYRKLRQAHGNQSCTWWKAQIINKWDNDA